MLDPHLQRLADLLVGIAVRELLAAQSAPESLREGRESRYSGPLFEELQSDDSLSDE